jgi:sulfoxide reductase heme-binding subunit YedZ
LTSRESRVASRESMGIGALKVLIWAGAAWPLAWMVWAGFTDHLGADPVRKAQGVTGLAALSLLLVTLAVTPLRRLTGRNQLVRVRRLLGLWAFAYVALHATIYFVLDQSLSLPLIWEDTLKHPRIFVGMGAFLLLIPLAATSTTASIRRLGGARWAAIHRLAYLAAALGALHYLWVVKWDVTIPALFALAYVGLMLPRLAPGRPARKERTPHPAPDPALR